MHIPFEFHLKVSLDVNRIKCDDNIGHWPADHDGALWSTNHFRHFIDTCCHPHHADVHAILQPEILSSDSEQWINVNAVQPSLSLPLQFQPLDTMLVKLGYMQQHYA